MKGMIARKPLILKALLVFALAATLSSCGGGGGGGGSTVLFTIGGTVSGLDDGEVLILQNNGADDLTIISNGDFTFATSLPDGSEYSVTVSRPPAGQECTINNPSGTIQGTDVTNVNVVCRALSS